jgi:hypothetical protein
MLLLAIPRGKGGGDPLASGSSGFYLNIINNILKFKNQEKTDLINGLD